VTCNMSSGNMRQESILALGIPVKSHPHVWCSYIGERNMHNIHFQTTVTCECGSTARDILHVCDTRSNFIFPTFCHILLFSFFAFRFHFILTCFLLRFLLSGSFFLSFLPFLFVFSSSIVRWESRMFSVGGIVYS